MPPNPNCIICQGVGPCHGIEEKVRYQVQVENLLVNRKNLLESVIRPQNRLHDRTDIILVVLYQICERLPQIFENFLTFAIAHGPFIKASLL